MSGFSVRIHWGAWLRLMALAVCFSLGSMSSAWAQSDAIQEPAFFYSFGKEVPLRIALDQIGILAVEGVREGRQPGSDHG